MLTTWSKYVICIQWKCPQVLLLASENHWHLKSNLRITSHLHVLEFAALHNKWNLTFYMHRDCLQSVLWCSNWGFYCVLWFVIQEILSVIHFTCFFFSNLRTQFDLLNMVAVIFCSVLILLHSMIFTTY